MTGKELKKLCEQYEDFEFEFCFTDKDDGSKFPNIRTFRNLEVSDVGYSDKAISLSGYEV